MPPRWSGTRHHKQGGSRAGEFAGFAIDAPGAECLISNVRRKRPDNPDCQSGLSFSAASVDGHTQLRSKLSRLSGNGTAATLDDGV